MYTHTQGERERENDMNRWTSRSQSHELCSTTNEKKREELLRSASAWRNSTHKGAYLQITQVSTLQWRPRITSPSISDGIVPPYHNASDMRINRRISQPPRVRCSSITVDNIRREKPISHGVHAHRSRLRYTDLLIHVSRCIIPCCTLQSISSRQQQLLPSFFLSAAQKPGLQCWILNTSFFLLLDFEELLPLLLDFEYLLLCIAGFWIPPTLCCWILNTSYSVLLDFEYLLLSLAGFWIPPSLCLAGFWIRSLSVLLDFE